MPGPEVLGARLKKAKAMPTYEYECRKCHHRFEEIQGISEKPIQTCPKCKGRVDRLISGGGMFLFKGSGFYITDHRSKDYKEKAKAEKPEAKTETKPEAAKPAGEGLKDKRAADS
jgi:putative FmdB family regulatory protein